MNANSVAESSKVMPAERSQTERPASRRLQVTIRDILVITAIFSVTFAAFLDWFAGLSCALYSGTVFSFAYLANLPTWREQLSGFDRRLIASLAVVVLVQAVVGYGVGYIRPALSDLWMEALFSFPNVGALILTGVAALSFAHNLNNLWTPDPFLLPACARALAATAIVSAMVLLCAWSRGPSDQMYWHGHERIAKACSELGEAVYRDPTVGDVRGHRAIIPDLGGAVTIRWEPEQILFERNDGEFAYLRRPENRTYRVIWRTKFGTERRIGEGSLDASPYAPVR